MSSKDCRKPVLRLLAALGPAQAYAVADPFEPGAVVVRAERGGVSVAAGRHEAAAAEDLIRNDLAAWQPNGKGAARLVATAAGRAHLRRAGVAADERFLAQHRETAAAEIDTGAERIVVTVHTEESPLAWMRRRRDRDGAPLIDAAAFEAGERLRRDLTLADILPSISARWDPTPAGTGSRGPAAATDAMVAARQRATLAIEAVGADFADLLIDLCGFLKGLETIERERGWPPRSAKVVVRLALGRLADHYGLDREARGRERSRGLLAWRAGSDSGEVSSPARRVANRIGDKV